MSHGKSKQEVLCNILNAYKIHPSIKKIEKKFKKIFLLSLLLEIEKLINCFDKNKAAGIDTIPPKLLEIEADF